jgi:hypothetical protein
MRSRNQRTSRYEGVIYPQSATVHCLDDLFLVRRSVTCPVNRCNLIIIFKTTPQRPVCEGITKLIFFSFTRESNRVTNLEPVELRYYFPVSKELCDFQTNLIFCIILFLLVGVFVAAAQQRVIKNRNKQAPNSKRRETPSTAQHFNDPSLYTYFVADCRKREKVYMYIYIVERNKSGEL